MANKPYTCHPDPLLLFIGMYLLWCGFNLLLPDRESIADTTLWKWAFLAAVYLIARLSPRKAWILWLLTAAGIVQTVYAIGQQTGYIASNHSLFPITGFMGNPGQMGGFQAVAFIAGMLLLQKTANRKLRLFVLIPALALISYSLWLSDSRASWIAAGLGLLVLYWSEIRTRLTIRKWLYIPLLIATVTTVILLFNYRSDSANARLLIWRVSADMIADKPLMGHGTGGFNQQYMLYQARYFEHNPDSRFLMVADNAAYPYNEFLHVAIEQGLISLILLLAVLITAFQTTPDKRSFAPLAGLLAFSLFSYPSYKPELLVLFPLLLGYVGQPLFSKQPRWRYGVLTAALIAILVILFTALHFQQKTNENKRLLMLQYDDQTAKFMSTNFDRHCLNLRYNTLYLHWMLKYPEMMDAKKLQRIFPTCENWCDIGDYYADQGRYDQAEAYYRTASQMIPTRILPNYQLWKLYLTQGWTEQAKQTAEHILFQPLKVENTFTLRVKGEVRRWYDQ